MYATRSWYFNEHNYMFLYQELHSLTEIGVFGTRKYLNKIWGELSHDGASLRRDQPSGFQTPIGLAPELQPYRF